MVVVFIHNSDDIVAQSVFAHLRFLSWLELLIALAQIDVVFLCWVVILMTAGPVIADRIGKDLSIAVEGAAGNWLLHGL